MSITPFLIKRVMPCPKSRHHTAQIRRPRPSPLETAFVIGGIFVLVLLWMKSDYAARRRKGFESPLSKSTKPERRTKTTRPSPAVAPARPRPTRPAQPADASATKPPCAPPITPVRGEQLRGAAWVIDGDTIAINRIKIRLAGVDAPELHEPWGKKSKWEMVRLCKGEVIRADLTGEISYDRVVATCYLPDGRDLGAELIMAGLALDYAHFSGGKYRHLETPELRRKLSYIRRKMALDSTLH